MVPHTVVFMGAVRNLLVVLALLCSREAMGQVPASSPSPSNDSPPAAPARVEVTFLEAARTVTASIQKTFYNEKTGLYAQTTTKREPEFMWGNGVMFSALVGAARHEPATYRPVVERFFGAMDRYWDAKVKVPGYEPAPTSGNGHDKYYDDNQWMVITFVEAYDLTKEAKYLERSKETVAFSLSGWDDKLDGGIWWHEGHKGDGKNTCSNAPAAVACLRVARHHDAPGNIEWARKIVKWMTANLQDKDGLFLDNKRVTDGRIDRRKFTYNSALMIRANLGLYRATKEQAYLVEAKRIGAACEAFINKETGAYRDGKKFSHLLVEADLELYRTTNDEALLARARRNGRVAWERWEKSPPKELIEQAAIARMLWLLADQETEVGREFWGRADGAAGAPK